MNNINTYDIYNETTEKIGFKIIVDNVSEVRIGLDGSKAKQNQLIIVVIWKCWIFKILTIVKTILKMIQCSLGVAEAGSINEVGIPVYLRHDANWNSLKLVPGEYEDVDDLRLYW